VIVASIDLELCQPSNRIIEVGITIGKIEDRSIIETRSYFINPQEQLTDYIINLTSIKQSDVDNAPLLSEVYGSIMSWLKSNKVHKMAITWGGDDIRLLREQVKEFNPSLADWCFGHRIMDVKTLVQAYHCAKRVTMKGGLQESMKRFGLKFEGDAHRADVDSLNTLKMYYHMLDMYEKIS
jgi:inhibitor of KinA sporulation pathway (predicted exonuclease)